MVNDGDSTQNIRLPTGPSLPSVGFVILVDGKIQTVNDFFLQLLRMEEGDLIGHDFLEFLAPESHEQFIQCVESIELGRSKNPTCILSILKGNMTPIQVSANISVIRVSNHQMITLILNDIATHTSLQSFLDVCMARYENIWETSPIAVFILTPTGIIQEVNPSAISFLRLDRHQILKRPFSAFLVKNTKRDPAQDIISEVMLGKILRGIELKMVSPEIGEAWVTLTASRMDRPEPSILVQVQDINQRKHAEFRARREWEQIHLMLEVMTHDMNNVNQSLLFAFGLLDSLIEIPPPLDEKMNEIQWNITRSARIISNLKTMIALFESPAPLEKTSIKACLQSAIDKVRNDIHWKAFEVFMNIDADIDHVVANAYLELVFFNIIHNAVYYNNHEHPHIEIRATKIDHGERVRIEISDNGIGIPDDLKEWVFKRTGTPEEQKVGRGLGLTLTDRIISLFNGRIWVENRIPDDYTQGSKFTIELKQWVEQKVLACGRAACIIIFTSDHCFFCEPVKEILESVAEEVGINPSNILEINLDDPNTKIKRPDIKMFPRIEICNHVLSGFVSADEIRTALSNVLPMDCVTL